MSGTVGLSALGPLVGRERAADLAAIGDRWVSDVTEDGVGRLVRELGPRVRSYPVGASFEGRPMNALSAGSGPLRVLVWGFPHPDEPIGAQAAASALRYIAQHPDCAMARHLNLTVVICADPDQAALNNAWTCEGTLSSLLNSVRPEHLAREVDYGFPLPSEWGPFWQPTDYDGALACRIAARCVSNSCGEVCAAERTVSGPYPESLALVAAVEAVQPHLVGSLHGTVSGGCYTFALHRPSPRLQAALEAIPGACGLPRHLGVKVDSGRPWVAGTIDVIREPTLTDAARDFTRQPGVRSGVLYLGNHSAAGYLEAQHPGVQFIVPEAPDLTGPEFGDRSPLGDVRPATWSYERRRNGHRWCLRGTLLLPDGSQQAALYRMQKEPPVAPTATALATTRGMLGVDAVMRRRWAWARCDRIWASLPREVRDGQNVIARELRATTLPAAHVNDRSMLIYRVGAGEDRPASVAEHADFAWRWQIETARRPARLARLIAESGIHAQSLAEELAWLVEVLTVPLPAHMRHATRRTEGGISQLARLLVAADELHR